MKSRIIKAGSRKSALALSQTRWVIGEIQRKHPSYEFEIVGITTQGDVILDQPLDQIGGKGLFVKELEKALLNHEIDFAVHSMKDLPVDIPEGLTIAAVSEREDPRDVLITSNDKLSYCGRSCDWICSRQRQRGSAP